MAPPTWRTLVADLCLWLCLWGHRGSSGCGHTQLAYSKHFGHDTKPARGTHMSYCDTSPLLLRHSCEGHGPSGGEPKAAMYLGKEVCVSLEACESSISPLPVPKELEAKEAIVSTINFRHKDGVSMEANSRAYMCLKSVDRWGPISSSHIPHVGTLKHPLLLHRSRPPPQGAQLDTFCLRHQALHLCQPHLPLAGRGYTFRRIETSTREQGALLEVYNVISFTITSLLIDRSKGNGAGKATGAYFRYNGTKNSRIIQHLALRGFIIPWTADTLLISANNGLITEVTVMPSVTFQSTTFPDSGFLLVTVTGSQVAVLTQGRHLFHSSISQVTSMVHIAKGESIDLKNTGMLFEERGWLILLSPEISNFNQLRDFNKHKCNLQLAVWRSQQSCCPAVLHCTVEILMGDFWNKIYCTDMHESLTLKVIFVPKPGRTSTPLVTVINPNVLVFSAYVIEVELTGDGNTKYLSHVVLEQEHFSEFADADFCNSVHDGEMSTVTVDIPGNPIGCIDVAPLPALVAVSCPPAKHIRIAKNVTVHDKEFIQEAAPRNNFSYTISHNIFDSCFLARKDMQQNYLQIKYNFTNVGYPLLVCYKNAWAPSFELQESNSFQEHIPAEFVPFEINRTRNWEYLLTAHDTNCISQPQNWTPLLEEQESPDLHTAWTRRNYKSLKDWNGSEFKWPSVKYQVLDGKSKIIFPPYNGLYIFKDIAMDLFYSYCDLPVTFSGYAYSAFPRNYLHFWASLTVFLILLLILTSYSLSHLRCKNMTVHTSRTPLDSQKRKKGPPRHSISFKPSYRVCYHIF
uniref:Cation channel sperm-associated auxiliary subunit delta n=1 Tax=Calidris pygmaea TaxID=425635 RepID=A0A8C3JU41_9CHAR